jgi:hypothetical protein
MSPPRQTSFFLVTKHEKRGDKEKQNFFREEAKFSRFGGQNLYHLEISRERPHFCYLSRASCARLAHFERERESERQREK